MKIEMLLMCITFQFKSGAPTQGISKRNSTNNVSWGGASTKRNWIPNFNRQCNICMTNQRYSFSLVFFILLNNN